MVVHSQVCGVRLSSSLLPLVGKGGGLVCELVGKADLLSDHFDSKHTRKSVDLPLTIGGVDLYSPAVWCSASYTYLKQLDRVVQSN